MKPNMGLTQRKVRKILGAVIMLASLLAHNGILAIIGGILFISGVIGYCPLCSIGKGSCGTQDGACHDNTPKTEEPKKDGGCCGGTH